MPAGYSPLVLWQLRGLVDALAGGPGPRRGRRDPMDVRVGDPIDFWRVEAFEPDRRLRLAAELRLPGRAWLEFQVAPDGAGGSVVRQTASFAPAGLAGKAYWYVIRPFHGLIFGRMLCNIAGAAGATKSSQSRHTSV